MGTLSRRELLTTFLGGAFAAAGCQSPPEPGLPPGELLDPNRKLGHRIRDGLAIEVPDGAWRRCEVVIIGGGVAGLAAARRLRQGGCDDFVLLEMESQPGGTAKGGQVAGHSCPWGAHYLPVPLKENRALVSLLDELGVLEGTDLLGQPLGAEEHLCRDPQERLFFAGAWYDGLYLQAGADGEDLRQWAAFRAELDRWVEWRDGAGRRAFALPMASGSDDPEVTVLDAITADDWLGRRGFTSSRLRWMVDYACRDDYGMRSAHVSAWAMLFYFVSRMVAPGGSGRPFLTWPDGNAHIVSFLARGSGARVRTGEAVVDVNPVVRDDRNVVDVTSLSADGKTARGYHARRVIFAAPRFLARHLLRPWRVRPPAHVADFEYGSWLVANLAVDSRPTGEGFPLAWDNVFYESPSLGYVVSTHQTGPDHGPTVLTHYYPLCDESPREGRKRLEEVGRDEWAEVALADLQRAHPDIRGMTSRIDVARWGHAMIRPRPGFVWGKSRREAKLPWRGIHFANTDLSGVALFEEAFYHGIRAAEEVLTEVGRKVDSIL